MVDIYCTYPGRDGQAELAVVEVAIVFIGRISLIHQDNTRLTEQLSHLRTSQQKPLTSSNPATQQPMTSSSQPATSAIAKCNSKFETGKRTIPGDGGSYIRCTKKVIPKLFPSNSFNIVRHLFSVPVIGRVTDSPNLLYVAQC